MFLSCVDESNKYSTNPVEILKIRMCIDSKQAMLRVYESCVIFFNTYLKIHYQNSYHKMLSVMIKWSVLQLIRTYKFVEEF